MPDVQPPKNQPPVAAIDSQENFVTHSNVEGDPPGAIGVAQCVESLRQTRIALAHNIGGSSAHPAVTNVKGPLSNGG